MVSSPPRESLLAYWKENDRFRDGAEPAAGDALAVIS